MLFLFFLYVIVSCTLHVVALIYTVKSVSGFSWSCIPTFSDFDSLLQCFLCAFILLSQAKFSAHLTVALD